MKSIIAILSSLILFLFSTLSVKAAAKIYLPLIANPATVQIVASKATPDFTVNNIRLWYVSENGGSPAPALQCGGPSKVQVHVFDVRGDHGDLSRLNDVTVHIVHFDGQGTQTEEEILTGQSSLAKGVVEFELKRSAEISIQYNNDGQVVSSDIATVTNLAYAISPRLLIASGYCTDETSCQAFVNAGVCNGNFSWNVVFKRSY